jgi:hypothetical protein
VSGRSIRESDTRKLNVAHRPRCAILAGGGATRQRVQPERAVPHNVVTDVARHHLARDWGKWCERDGRDGSGLRVDVTFEDCGIALELTSLQDSVWLAANSAARKLERQLTTFARDRSLQGWVVAVSSTARLMDIAAAAMPLMESGTEIRPMRYSSRDLADAEANGELDEFLERHRDLHGLGLSLLQRRPDSDSVFFMVAGAGFQILGFTHLLAEALAVNAVKLREARPRETHLAVLVGRWDLSNAPSETAPPAFPDDVDVLWIVHPVRGNPEALVWLAHRGDDNWRVFTTAIRYQ